MTGSTLTAPSSGNGSDGAVQATLVQALSARWRRIMAGYFLGRQVYRTVKDWRLRAEAELAYTVTVGQQDDLYPDVLAWLLDLIPHEKRRSVRISTARTRHVSPIDVDDTPSGVRVHFDGHRTQTVTIDGERVKITIDADSTVKDDEADYGFGRRFAPKRIVFTCRNRAGQLAVVAFLDRIARARTISPRPRLYIATRWGDWNRYDDAPTRDLATVYLPDGVLADVVDDLQRFLDQEADYDRLGIPWHRGYLFWGPPGTGKTSLAKALAGTFGLDLYYLPLGDLEKDVNLANLLAGVGPRSILLLEDIDVATRASHDRTEGGDSKGLTASGLLNALDGVITPHGLVTIMTTNDRTALDPALIRPGRADRQVEVSYLDDDQFRALVAGLCDGILPAGSVAGRQVTPAAVVEVLKHHIGDPAAGVAALDKEYA